MAKYQGDCRLTHYSALLRRALNAAGFEQVPIVSTDPADTKEMHPGFRLGVMFNVRSLWVITMMDMLEELRRQIRPYELNKGETNRIFDETIDANQIDKMIKLLDSNDLKEINDIRFRLSKYNKYMEFFMKEFDKNEKGEYF